MEILENKALNQAIGLISSNYNFEIHKTIWRITELKKKLNKEHLIVCLQMPEGLLIFASLIADLLNRFTGCSSIIHGEVTYGACCVDDLTAVSLHSDLIVHYAHSCLIPVTETRLNALYIFVDIAVDVDHILKTIEINFPDKEIALPLLGIIQFQASLSILKEALVSKGYKNVKIPQERPRCAGEVLGCTSPVLDKECFKEKVAFFLGDGRFHIEASMIANPEFTFYQYDPYTKKITIEHHDYKEMMGIRHDVIKRASKDLRCVGIILGTLGRQGSTHILDVKSSESL